MRIKFQTPFTWTVPVIALVVFAGNLAFRELRDYALGTGQGTSGAPRWWGLLLCFYSLILIIVAISLTAVFRQIGCTRAVVIRGFVNAFVSCLFFALASITGDRLVLPALSSVGLGTLHNWLFSIALLWSFLGMYFLFDDIDRSRGGTYVSPRRV